MKNFGNYLSLSISRLKPWQRLAVSGFCAALVFFLLKNYGHTLNSYVVLLITWDVFAFVYLVCCWAVFIFMRLSVLKHIATQEDGGKWMVFILVILFSIAGLVIIMLLLSKNIVTVPRLPLTIAAVLGMFFSWLIVHTIFSFHYAHLYYKNNMKSGGLAFPGNQEPDYLDFAYFSIVIGCTFQVSDVEITSKKIRHLVLLHGLLAFMLNTFVVALSINILLGFIQHA